MKNRRIYLDYAATTPVDSRVLKKIMPFFSEKYGNPSSIHFIGQEAKQELIKARKKVAKFLNCSPEEVIFTSGGTESENLAIKGIVFLHQQTWAPIVPVALIGTFGILSLKTLLRKNKVKVRIGKPIYSLDNASLEEGVNVVMQKIAELLNVNG